ncbi:transducin/WD40 repeat-like superfamily protein [Artemisia annua]|uniref:Transducin/WD40 repeat-like superfamily protein n=1 Tax=Artemisia annua TaxID=35608 RepID=A0A2U1LMV9_ARTAN|nr:transducin/WD40 repeat-like superfamily protein [Artemisia annua]
MTSIKFIEAATRGSIRHLLERNSQVLGQISDNLSALKENFDLFSQAKNNLSAILNEFQAVPLVASPSYSNSIAWSHENLLAVASGHLVTILNPALPSGPKGLITIPSAKPFPIGLIPRHDLLSPCMLPTCLSRDVRPCVRSISWSPLGFSPHAGKC